VNQTSQIYESSASCATVSRQLITQNKTHNETLSAKLKVTKVGQSGDLTAVVSPGCHDDAVPGSIY